MKNRFFFAEVQVRDASDRVSEFLGVFGILEFFVVFNFDLWFTVSGSHSFVLIRAKFFPEVVKLHALLHRLAPNVSGYTPEVFVTFRQTLVEYIHLVGCPSVRLVVLVAQ